jgi:hypothetical protein
MTMALAQPKSGVTEQRQGLTPADLENALQLGWLPPALAALEAVPAYLDQVWKQLHTIVGTAQFARLAERVQNRATDYARAGYSPSYGPGEVQDSGVSLDDLALIRTDLAALLFGQAQSALLLKALRLGLDGQVIGHDTWAVWPRRQTGWRAVPHEISHPAATAASVQGILAEARRRLGTPAEPASLRALASWPSYLRLAWADLQSTVTSAGFLGAAAELAVDLADAAEALPRCLDLTRRRLAADGVSEAELDRAYQLVVAYDDSDPVDLLTTAFVRYPLTSARTVITL